MFEYSLHRLFSPLDFSAGCQYWAVITSGRISSSPYVCWFVAWFYLIVGCEVLRSAYVSDGREADDVGTGARYEELSFDVGRILPAKRHGLN